MRLYSVRIFCNPSWIRTSIYHWLV